jgi:DNA-binding NtrC family response regulator
MDPNTRMEAPLPDIERRQAVIVVDDESENLLALERAFRNESFELLMTTDPSKVLEWLRTRRVAVIIADQRMPSISGTALLQMALEASPKTARILLTAYPGDREILQARDEGLLTLFPKPWNIRELTRKIHERLREREILEGV